MKNKERYSRIPVGIIGCGNISKTYALAGRKFEGIELVACADIDVSRARALAEEEGVPRALDVLQLLADPGIVLVINLTIPRAHAEMTAKAIRAGKHVYSEKPLALRRREARECIGLARDKGLRIGCAPDTFLGAGLQTCRKLIDEGEIGVPLAGAGFMLTRGPESWHPNPEFLYKKGGGPLFDMGPYYLAAFTALLGPVKRVTGSARSSFKQREITSQPLAGTLIDVDVHTHVCAVLDFDSGPVVTLTTSFDVTGTRLPKIEIFGSEGTLAVPDPNTFGGPVWLLRRGEKEWREMPLEFGYAENSRGIGVADMAAAIAAGREHRANERLAYHVLDLMHSIVDASETGHHIEMRSAMSRPEPLPQGLPAGKVDC
jgi:predicted dehydrogenase